MGGGSTGDNAVGDVGVESVGAGVVPHQKSSSPERRDGDAVRPPAVTAVKAVWLEERRHSCASVSAPDDIVDCGMSREATWVSVA